MNTKQKEAIRYLFAFLGLELLAIGGSIGLFFLFEYMNRQTGILHILSFVVVFAIIAAVICALFVIPFHIGEEGLDMHGGIVILLSILLGLSLMIIPIRLLANAAGRTE